MELRKQVRQIRLWTLVCFWAAGQSAGAQNLVSNSTLEGKCIKSGYGQLVQANAWSNANDGTADLFDKNKHKKTTPNAIPFNYMGYQPSADGQNYAGIAAFYDDGNYFDSTGGFPRENDIWVDELRMNDGYKRYTEYLQAEFREPMVAGITYEVSFRVNLADKSGRAVSCLGALITTQKVKQANNTFLSQTPQFITHKVITDSVNWVTLSGAYIAAGGEKYLTIGCFRDEDFRVQKLVNDYQNDSHKAYYYVSEVSVTPYLSPRSNLDAIMLGMDYMELMNVQFATGSAEITPQFYPELNEVAEWMINYPQYKFFIAGYTDKQGGDAVNDPLSLARAASVKKYLVSKGVKSDNVVSEGFGSDNPVENKWKSRKNRRVEIYLYTVTKLSQL